MRGRWIVAGALTALVVGLAPAAEAQAPAKITRSGWSCEAPSDSGQVSCKGTLKGIRADTYREAIDDALLYLHRYSRSNGGYVTLFSGAGQNPKPGRWTMHMVKFAYGPEPSTWIQPKIDELLAQR